MNKKIIIYESAMCCSSGVCGPSPDQALLDLQDALEEIKKMGSEVERYSITQNPKKFRENPQVIKLIQEQQLKALPITTFNGNVVKSGSYPTLEELKKLLKDGADYLAPSLLRTRLQNKAVVPDKISAISAAHLVTEVVLASDAGSNCC